MLLIVRGQHKGDGDREGFRYALMEVGDEAS